MPKKYTNEERMKIYENIIFEFALAVNGGNEEHRAIISAAFVKKLRSSMIYYNDPYKEIITNEIIIASLSQDKIMEYTKKLNQTFDLQERETLFADIYKILNMFLEKDKINEILENLNKNIYLYRENKTYIIEKPDFAKNFKKDVINGFKPALILFPVFIYMTPQLALLISVLFVSLLISTALYLGYTNDEEYQRNLNQIKEIESTQKELLKLIFPYEDLVKKYSKEKANYKDLRSEKPSENNSYTNKLDSTNIIEIKKLNTLSSIQNSELSSEFTNSEDQFICTNPITKISIDVFAPTEKKDLKNDGQIEINELTLSLNESNLATKRNQNKKIANIKEAIEKIPHAWQMDNKICIFLNPKYIYLSTVPNTYLYYDASEITNYNEKFAKVAHHAKILPHDSKGKNGIKKLGFGVYEIKIPDDPRVLGAEIAKDTTNDYKLIYLGDYCSKHVKIDHDYILSLKDKMMRMAFRKSVKYISKYQPAHLSFFQTSDKSEKKIDSKQSEEQFKKGKMTKRN